MPDNQHSDSWYQPSSDSTTAAATVRPGEQPPLRALVVDPELADREVLLSALEEARFAITSADSLAEAADLLAGGDFEIVVAEVDLPDGSGTALLDVLQEDRDPEVVFLTDEASVDSLISALRGGAADYLVRPLDRRRLDRTLAEVRRRARLEARVAELHRTLRSLGRFDGLVGASPAMQEVYQLIERVAPTDATVLVTGETGTGKERVARALHRNSRRSDAAFVAVNCGAVPSSLMESEFFGHEKGAFTGADSAREGLFERADGGTLFLDEITEMPQELQVKLLRVLETREVRRVGGRRAKKVDVRIVAATNREPEAAVKEGKLREDLLYRLAVFPLPLPPLRVRPGDPSLIAQAYLEVWNERNDTEKAFSPEALAALENHEWPGNVRELVNAVERAAIVATGRDIGPEALPFAGPGRRVSTASPGTGDAPGSPGAPPPGLSIAEVEKRHILATLEHVGGSKKDAAAALGISLKTLYNRLKKYRAED